MSRNDERRGVSVIIPCYRSGATVGRAVSSVLAQTLLPNEVILIDDASGDDTPSILDQLAADYGRSIFVRVVLLDKNVGAASARNIGWTAASGRYIAFLDSDDTWHPRKLEIQCELMESSPDLATTGHLHCVTADTIAGRVVSPCPDVVRLTFSDFLWRNRFVTSSVLVRAGLPYRFSDGQRYMEDQRLWLEMAGDGIGMARIESELAAHHKPDFGAGGLSGNLVAMARAELGNYLHLHNVGRLTVGWLLLMLGWSLIKFVRRLVIVGFRRIAARP